MYKHCTDHTRRLLFALLAMLALAMGPAAAADYTAGVASINGSTTLWFQGSAVNQAIAHYKVAGGPQQNVNMAYNGARARHELAVPAAAGQTINYQFTYMKNGLAYDSPWAAATVPAGDSPGVVATPAFSPPAGVYGSAQQVTVSTRTSGATLQCSINGGAMAACANPIMVSATTTIAALASKAGMTSSGQASGTWTIGAAEGAFTHGVVDNGSSLTVWFARTPKSDWVDIHYSVNGGAQQNVAMSYNGTRHQVTVPVAAGGAVSLAYSFTYMTGTGARDGTGLSWKRGDGGTGGTVATPVFSPAGGAYSAAQTVRISSPTPGASIYYALNGGAQQRYSDAAPLTIAASATLSAFGRKAGMADSPTATASYTITPAGGGETFSHGVAEDGATARIWFAPAWTSSLAIAHYYVTGKDGAKGPQRDEAMTYNSVQRRWFAPLISPLASGATISYMFTYAAPGGGNKDSAWFTYAVCGDDAPDSPACPNPVGKPVFSPAPGLYPTAQNVTLALPAGSVAGTRIHYTLDGSAPTVNSPQYAAGAPLAVRSAVTINAIAVRPDLLQSRRASATYDIEPACTQSAQGCTVAAPTMSHASGAYATRIGVNMLTSTPGATVHYTRDGSTPTRESPQFNGAIWLYKSVEFGDTFTLKALATKNGVDSPIVSRTFTITSNAESAWNGMTTFNVVNGTGGKYRDDQVYWLIIGKDWVTGQYVRADQSGRLIPVSEGDNTIAVPGRDKPYANYGVSLAQAKSVNIAPIESARIYMSVGKPVLVQINRDINGRIGYAGPDLENSTDPNLATTFDFGEFNINRPRPASDYPGIFVNTSRVDIFGLPLKLRVTGLDGYDATVGETLLETREELFARFALETPPEFRSLAKAPYAPYRISAPAHATFNDGLNVRTGEQVKPRGEHAAYLDAYISEIWNKYRNETLTMKVGDWPIFSGRVGPDDVFTFTDGLDTYNIYGKPTTTEVMLGNGVLDDATGTTPRTPKHDKQLQLQAQICAALNRHVAEQPNSRWYDASYFYPAGKTANFFTKFWHDHSINGLAYGFSYDDVGGHSPSIYTPSPVSVTYTIGK